MTQKIFISYSHANSVFAKAIARYLQRRQYQVWIDTEQIKAGNNWSNDIDEAISQADYIFCILSADSVRRKEVIREACLGLKLHPERLLFLKIGNVHDSWFINKDNVNVKKLLQHLHSYQHIEFNSRGDITIERMMLINDFLLRGYTDGDAFYKKPFEGYTYIAANGEPESVLDAQNGHLFYKVMPYDLSVATGYPFALDNQWIPETIYQNEGFWLEFEKNGFASSELSDIVKKEQENCFIVSLIHMRQLIINKSALLNTSALRNCYMQKSTQRSFVNLLRNGSIIVFLYGEGEMTPFVHKQPKYETEKKSIEKWNKLCAKNPVYCIRENWGNTIDQHSIDFVKFCCTIADNIDDNVILSESFGMDVMKRLQFFSVLRDIGIQSFLRARMSGTNVHNNIKGLSRSYFYRNFIVREESASSPKPTLNCLFDKGKPFHLELKRMVDFYYNSLFTNYFQCWPLIPVNVPSNLTFLSQLYLKQYDYNVDVEEVEYALSEFMTYQTVLNQVAQLGCEIFINKWNLKKVELLRSSDYWVDYISSFENIVRRCHSWQIDFSELNYTVERFVQMLQPFHLLEGLEKSLDPCYSFRVMVGSSVIDLVVSQKWKKYKDLPGTYKKDRNPVQIIFQLGDITNPIIQDTIFHPICFFRGASILNKGKDFHDKLERYLIDNGFLKMF